MGFVSAIHAWLCLKYLTSLPPQHIPLERFLVNNYLNIQKQNGFLKFCFLFEWKVEGLGGGVSVKGEAIFLFSSLFANWHMLCCLCKYIYSRSGLIFRIFWMYTSSSSLIAFLFYSWSHGHQDFMWIQLLLQCHLSCGCNWYCNVIFLIGT